MCTRTGVDFLYDNLGMDIPYMGVIMSHILLIIQQRHRLTLHGLEIGGEVVVSDPSTATAEVIYNFSNVYTNVRLVISIEVH